MGSRLTPLGIFAKWLVLPVAVASLGYFVVGPVLGQNAKKHSQTADKSKSSSSAPTTTSAHQEPSVTVSSTQVPAGEPTVKVGVRRSEETEKPAAVTQEEEDTPKPTPRRARSKRKKAKPSEDMAAPPTEPDSPPADPASTPGDEEPKTPDNGNPNS